MRPTRGLSDARQGASKSAHSRLLPRDDVRADETHTDSLSPGEVAEAGSLVNAGEWGRLLGNEDWREGDVRGVDAVVDGGVEMEYGGIRIEFEIEVVVLDGKR